MRRISNDITEMEQIIKNICEVKTGNDFITIEILGIKGIIPEKEYPGEGEPQIMYDIAMRFAEELFQNEYEVVVAVHTDRDLFMHILYLIASIL